MHQSSKTTWRHIGRVRRYSIEHASASDTQCTKNLARDHADVTAHRTLNSVHAVSGARASDAPVTHYVLHQNSPVSKLNKTLIFSAATTRVGFFF